MLINRKEMIHAIKFLLPAIGQNESRRSLMNLHVEQRGQNIFFTAADAYKIKCARLTLTEEKKNFKPFMIPRHVLIYYRQMLVKGKSSMCDITRSELKIDNIGINYKQPEVDYPDLSRLIAGKTEGGKDIYKNQDCAGRVPIGLNAKLIHDCMIGFDGYDVVKMEIGAEDTPVRYTSQCGNFICIQMSVRIKW